MYSRIALTQQGPFRQLQEKRHKKKQQKTRRFRNKQQTSRNWTVFTWKILEALSQKNDDKQNSPKKGTIWCTEMRVVWFAGTLPLSPQSHQRIPWGTKFRNDNVGTGTLLDGSSRSSATTYLGFTRRHPSRVIQNHGNPSHLLLGGSNLQQIYG